MALGLSHRSSQIEQAEIRNMSIECEKIGGINLAQGVCDTPVPLAIREGAYLGMDAGINSYTRFDGLAQLRYAIAEKLYKQQGMKADPETEIVVHSGSTGAFYTACLALLDPGDEVILFEPYYGYHLNTLIATEIKPAFVTLHAPYWSFSPQDLEQAVTPRTRGIMINTPANPSGKVFTRDELMLIADFAERHNLFVFTDEIYEYFIYDGRHISPATLPGMRERTITISGYSKTFSITGWRVGYSICDAKWTLAIAYFHDLVYVCAPAPLQMGVAEGITSLPETFYAEIAREYLRKRDLLCNTLKEIGLTPSVPNGAYYVLADASSLPGRTSKEKSMALLEATGVATVAGSAFYHAGGGENLVRFCFAKNDTDLEEACRRLLRLRNHRTE